MQTFFDDIVPVQRVGVVVETRHLTPVLVVGVVRLKIMS